MNIIVVISITAKAGVEKVEKFLSK